MSTKKEISRGYVKWYDDDGTFHKEPLADHPDMLADATPAQQLDAEEAKRLNAAGEEALKVDDKQQEEEIKTALEELKAAPKDILTADQLDAEPLKTDNAGEIKSTDKTVDEDHKSGDGHEAALEALAEKTS